MAALRYLAFLFAVIIAFAGLGLSACSSDSGSNPAAGAGGSSIGGSGGSSAGGTAGTGGTSQGSWKKGVVGKSKGAITLAKNAGIIQGFAVTTGMKVMDGNLDGGDPDALADANDPLDGGDEAGVPDTTPKVDLSGITPDFTEMWIPVPPYVSMDNQPTIAPFTAILKPDGTMSKISHFPDWNTDFALNCFSTFVAEVNGTQLKSYSGLSFDLADCMSRHFMISNSSDKVWELFADGTKQVLASGIVGASSMICHPEGYLAITTLPQYAKGNDTNPPEVAPKLMKVTLDGQTSTIADLPVGADYATLLTFSPCFAFPFTQNGMPIGIRQMVTLRSDASYLVGDVGARKIYAIDSAGVVTEFASMDLLTVSAILAPNDIIYKVDAPFIGELNGSAPFILAGASISGYDGAVWNKILDLTGYDAFVNNMSSGQIKVNCPAEFQSLADKCYQPWGVFIKIAFGATPTIYIMDPVKGEIIAIPLDMGGGDAGAPDAEVPDTGDEPADDAATPDATDEPTDDAADEPAEDAAAE